jgi:gamma-glutamyltranspeptidase / glutathione hydrolase
MTRVNATWRLVALALVTVAVVDAPSSRAAHGPPLTTRNGVVAADDPKASEVGAAVLARGGNAVDGAIATAFALGVLNPASSGIGGGGFAVVHDAATGKTYVYDFRETAPAALGPEDFRVDGKVDPTRSLRGGLAVGVPGEVAGLWRLHERHGALSWRRVVSPAARLARDGFEVPWFLTYAAGATLKRLPEDAMFDPLRALIRDRKRGDRLARESLGVVLLAIATQGPVAFYEGAVAERMVATVRDAGGVLTLDDLKGYEVVEREPLWAAWRGMKIATMPLPSSGGAILLEDLGIVDALEARGVLLAKLGAGSSAYLHVIAEVLKHGFADRARLLGDTDDARALAARLQDGLDAIAKRIDLDRTSKHETYGHPAMAKDGGTSHICVIDDAGNAVALTTTVNGYFGSKLLTPDGVVLNNEIDDFMLEAGVPNQFGLVQSERNLVAPGKRPLSSMTPVLLFDDDGKVVGCAGGSGGPNIISNVFQVLVGVYVLGLDARAAVEAPRVHHQWLPDELRVEDEVPADVRAGLEKRGHTLVPVPQPTAVQMIRVLPDGTREAASDPRKNGVPAAAP